MLLPADGQCSLDAMRTGGERAFRVSAHNAHRRRMKAAGSDGVFNGQDGGKRLVLGDHSSSTEPGGFGGFAQNPRNRLRMKNNFCREEGLIVAGTARVAFARNIGGGQSSTDAGLPYRRNNVEFCQSSMRVGREDRPGMEQIGETSQQVIGVESLACNVTARAFMRNSLADNLHATASSSCSHQNFSSSDCASARR